MPMRTGRAVLPICLIAIASALELTAARHPDAPVGLAPVHIDAADLLSVVV
ncbi:MAG: hypothetical protein M3Q88_02255 [Pseudomonadota bacterium]|nr:hypothetical protein [Pseudomonadota bacterium]